MHALGFDPAPRRATQTVSLGRAALAVLALAGATSAQVSSVEQRRGAWQKHLQMAAESPFRELAWRCAGPEFQGGRIEAIAWHESEPRTIYVGAGSGGVFKTLDDGRTWAPIFDRESTTSIGSIAVAPSNPELVWVGTGETHPSGTSFPGTGIFKSNDGGETWRCMGLHDSQHIARVIVDPRDEDVVYAGVMGHHRSANRQRGVFKTSDGGETWKKVLFVHERAGVVDLVMDPRDPSTLVATTWDRGRRGSRIHKSVDGGATWSELEKGLPPQAERGRISVDITTERGRMYALVVNRKLARGRSAGGAELYRSDDAGATFRRTHERPLQTWIGWDFCDVRAAPDDPDRVYLCGQILLVSDDAGETIRKAGTRVRRLHPQRTRAFHLDMHEIVLDPKLPGRILLGTDGGFFVSEDHAKSWLHLNTLPIGEFYTVHLDSEKPYRIWGGTQDNASLLGPSTYVVDSRSSDPWRHLFLDPWGGGDGFATFPDPTDSKLFYYEHQNGDMRRKRLDLPPQLSVRDKRIRPTAKRGESRLRFAWHTPLFVSAHEPATLYCAAQRVFKSTSRGDAWTAISEDLSPAGVLSLSESPLERGLLYAGCTQSRVYVTENDGGAWAPVCEGLPKKPRIRLLASRHRKGTVYAALRSDITDDYGAYLYRSDDNGKAWKAIASGLPADSIFALAEDPRDADILYVGTLRGVYVTLDGGVTWKSLGRGLPAVPVFDMAVHPRELELVVATHGRSIWIVDVESIPDAK